MVRQPLARAGNPLAFCDYHAVAAPYLDSVQDQLAGTWGRGAAGRPSTKLAFMLALESYIPAAAEEEIRAQARQPLRRWVDDALSAFRDDFSYCAAMASAAQDVLRRRPLAA